MIYRGPGFLAVYDLAPSTPSPSSQLSKFSFFLSIPVCRPSSSLTEGGRTKSKDGEKAWFSVNHSILFAFIVVGVSSLFDGREGAEKWSDAKMMRPT
jgi:hypothetical protein